MDNFYPSRINYNDQKKYFNFFLKKGKFLIKMYDIINILIIQKKLFFENLLL